MSSIACRGKLLESKGEFDRCQSQKLICGTCKIVGCSNPKCTQHNFNGSCLSCGGVFVHDADYKF